MYSNKKSNKEADDEAYLDPSDSGKQSRTSYSRARSAVEKRQGMRLTGGNFEYESAITPNKWNQLDALGRETFPKQAHKGGVIKQKPALDHIVQYAALKEHDNSSVVAERDNASKSLKRRCSFDLHLAL